MVGREWLQRLRLWSQVSVFRSNLLISSRYLTVIYTYSVYTSLLYPAHALAYIHVPTLSRVLDLPAWLYMAVAGLIAITLFTSYLLAPTPFRYPTINQDGRSWAYSKAKRLFKSDARQLVVEGAAKVRQLQLPITSLPITNSRFCYITLNRTKSSQMAVQWSCFRQTVLKVFK
jgi:hypothetical protein